MWLLSWPEDDGKSRRLLFYEKEDLMNYALPLDVAFIVEKLQVYVRPEKGKTKERIEPLVPLSRYKED